MILRLLALNTEGGGAVSRRSLYLLSVALLVATIGIVLVSTNLSGIFTTNPGEDVTLAQYQGKAQHEAEPGELLVTFKTGAPPVRIKQINESLGVVVIDTMFAGRIYQVKVPPKTSIEKIREEYLSYKEVLSVEPNYRVKIK